MHTGTTATGSCHYRLVPPPGLAASTFALTSLCYLQGWHVTSESAAVPFLPWLGGHTSLQASSSSAVNCKQSNIDSVHASVVDTTYAITAIHVSLAISKTALWLLSLDLSANFVFIGIVALYYASTPPFSHFSFRPSQRFYNFYSIFVLPNEFT